MPRNKISFSKRSKSPKPAPPLCGVSNCHHKCWMGSLRGEMVESEYCEKHTCEARPVCVARKRSKDSFCHEHTTCVFPDCKLPYDDRYGPSCLSCPDHTCQIQNCSKPIADFMVPFCLLHNRDVFVNMHNIYSLRSCMEYNYLLPQPATQEMLSYTTELSEEDSPPPPTTISTADSSAKSCTCAYHTKTETKSEAKTETKTETKAETKTEVKPEPQSDTKTETKQDTAKPAPVTSPVEPKVEPKMEDAKLAKEKDEVQEEDKTMPAFFSGIAAGLCIFMQILYVLLQLVLEMTRGTAKWRG